MRVLWIPHVPQHFSGWDGCRQFRLFRHLESRVDLHVATWRQPKSLRGASRWGTWCSSRDWYGQRYEIALAPNFHRLVLRRRYPPAIALALNQRLFCRAVCEIADTAKPDCTVCSITHHWTGYPPFDRLRPFVLDHVDRTRSTVEDRYFTAADAVIAVSDALLPPETYAGKPKVVIPNGVDLARYVNLDRDDAKRALGLSGTIVVSLVGLTCSERLYFVDAMAIVVRRFPEAKLLVVGGGPERDAIKDRARKLGVPIMAPGHVPSEKVPLYFAASDVGLYPGDRTPWFLDATPLKIIEYSACNVPVVSSPVRFFLDGWPNVLTVEPEVDAFASAIQRALQFTPQPLNLRPFDWGSLADKFELFLRDVSGKPSGLDPAKP